MPLVPLFSLVRRDAVQHVCAYNVFHAPLTEATFVDQTSGMSVREKNHAPLARLYSVGIKTANRARRRIISSSAAAKIIVKINQKCKLAPAVPKIVVDVLAVVHATARP